MRVLPCNLTGFLLLLWIALTCAARPASGKSSRYKFLLSTGGTSVRLSWQAYPTPPAASYSDIASASLVLHLELTLAGARAIVKLLQIQLLCRDPAALSMRPSIALQCITISSRHVSKLPAVQQLTQQKQLSSQTFRHSVAVTKSLLCAVWQQARTRCWTS